MNFVHAKALLLRTKTEFLYAPIECAETSTQKLINV